MAQDALHPTNSPYKFNLQDLLFFLWPGVSAGDPVVFNVIGQIWHKGCNTYAYYCFSKTQTFITGMWRNYNSDGLFDEMMCSPQRSRPPAQKVIKYLQSLSDDEIRARQQAAEASIVEMGITFTVYSEGTNIDRAWPFDVIPRIISGSEWAAIEAGLSQRVRALNMFIDDIYSDQRIIRDGVIPAEVLANSTNFRRECVGIRPRHGVWAHICGSDLIRDEHGVFHVLEDNLRVPSGVSYMLENRVLTKQVFSELFEDHSIKPVADYPNHLFDMLASLCPRAGEYPEVVVLTPGIYNSAYFEHSFLAQQMGVELVEGPDLIVGEDDCVYTSTIDGLRRVDVIYRRIDDLFLDPEVFNKDSKLGVHGLMHAWRKGNVGLANAPGAGVADDKVVYAFVPGMIKYYLDEDPKISGVETFLCLHKRDREHVLSNMDKLVIKPANESGGYGMLIGPVASRKERESFALRIKANPRNYVAQPLIKLSTVPTVCGNSIEARHVDLRPFILQGDKMYITPGGLTRVASRKGSTVVNSSQGGGSKDTWVVDSVMP